MKHEVFDITVDGIVFTIKTSLPPGPHNIEHELWKGNDLLFAINPQINECDEPCWQLSPQYTNSNISKELISKIGEAIEMHYV